MAKKSKGNTKQQQSLLMEKKKEMGKVFFGSISSIMLLLLVKLTLILISIKQTGADQILPADSLSTYLAVAFIVLGTIFFFTKKERYLGFGIILGSILFILIPFN